MRRVLGIILMSVGLFIVCAAMLLPAVTGCAKGGGLTLNPERVDWKATSDFYNRYIMGFAVPIGSAAAAITVPRAQPLIEDAVLAANKLEELIEAKASDKTIEEQAWFTKQLIEKINNAVQEAKRE